jgi:hypothetical protein
MMEFIVFIRMPVTVVSLVYRQYSLVLHVSLVISTFTIDSDTSHREQHRVRVVIVVGRDRRRVQQAIHR